MMTLDRFNVLDKWPLDGWDDFRRECHAHGVQTIYLTGTNTDPMLYRHIGALYGRLAESDYAPTLGVRTNGVNVLARRQAWKLFDKASTTICSFDEKINRAMMGGPPPNLPRILALPGPRDLKVNVVLGPENRDEVERTIEWCAELGVPRVNLREPYGQPHVGDPLPRNHKIARIIYGMPEYDFGATRVLYWNVHYVEVESVNLYASGRVSGTYPITKGCADDGIVLDQTHFARSGRIREQWLAA